MSNVISLTPKTVRGRTRNCAWSYSYDRNTRTWTWRVEVAIEPQVFSGTADSEQEAKKVIHSIIYSGKVPSR
jgi:hypothetical protein